MNAQQARTVWAASNFNEPAFMNMLWGIFLQNLNNGAWDAIEMPDTVKAIVGQGGLHLFKARYRSVATIITPLQEDN